MEIQLAVLIFTAIDVVLAIGLHVLAFLHHFQSASTELQVKELADSFRAMSESREDESISSSRPRRLCRQK